MLDTSPEKALVQNCQEEELEIGDLALLALDWGSWLRKNTSRLGNP